MYSLFLSRVLPAVRALCLLHKKHSVTLKNYAPTRASSVYNGSIYKLLRKMSDSGNGIARGSVPLPAVVVECPSCSSPRRVTRAVRRIIRAARLISRFIMFANKLCCARGASPRLSAYISRLISCCRAERVVGCVHRGVGWHISLARRFVSRRFD